MSIRVAISGSGRMGSQVVEAISAAEDLEAVAIIDQLATVDVISGLPVFTDAGKCLDAHSPDVVIDFTNADWTPKLAEAALARKVRMVSGTTGLPDSFFSWLDRESESQQTGVIFASNFAIGAVLMMHFARIAAPYFEAAEIIELHHDQKVDSPSGTAKSTADMMNAAREKAFSHTDSEKEILPGARGAETGGIAVHSVRLPGLVAHQEVIFGGLGQTLTIRHDSTGRDSFMPGVTLAAREVMDLDSLVIGLDRVLGLGG